MHTHMESYDIINKAFVKYMIELFTKCNKVKVVRRSKFPSLKCLFKILFSLP